ncbi:MAG: DNA mismatch endonuclease Vsr [Planctomycetaceae bacterium]|nr:DNA mismatch endonuclease Vsr [Planctomycetaceae bacterium]
MADTITAAERSRIMAAVRSRHTSPELAVRRIVASLGVRYRLHGKNVPGSPDLVVAPQRKVLFVHGCFWHRHSCRRGQSTPAANKKFWAAKFARNVARDADVRRALRREGWRALIVWECQLTPAKLPATVGRIRRFLVAEPSTVPAAKTGKTAKTSAKTRSRAVRSEPQRSIARSDA